MEETFDTIVIDPDIQSRMRLKSATNSVGSFKNVQLVGEIKQGQILLTAAESVDIIFISSRIDRNAILNFIVLSKKTHQGQDVAYVLLMEPGQQENSALAMCMLDGFDGFLIEPYSVNGLIDITNLATKVKRERGLAREKMAIGLLIKEIMGQIDIIAQLKAGGAGANLSVRALKETCSVLTSFEGKAKDAYQESLISLFVAAPKPGPRNPRIYSGVSKRIKERQEAKMMAKLKARIVQVGEKRAAGAGG